MTKPLVSVTGALVGPRPCDGWAYYCSPCGELGCCWDTEAETRREYEAHLKEAEHVAATAAAPVARSESP